jgi:histidyl-tRNA synthetase
MRKADASGARYAAIIGEDEARAGLLTVKALRTAAAEGDQPRKAGEQAKLNLAEAVALLAPTN